ncbi:porin family protein [bacterium]|nr:porin family protein [bacterium]MBU1983067.1 porin family protein [bacterium]
MRVFLAIVALSLTIPALAGSYPLGVGAYGGFDMPIIQDDVGSGPMWAISVRGNVWRFVHAQIIVRGTSQGDVEEEAPFDVVEKLKYKGGTLTGFGLHVLFAKKDAANIWPYGLIGMTSNSLSFGDSWKESDNLFGWAFGGGLGVNLYQRQLYLDVNSSFLMMPFHDNKASRKNWQSLIGVQYFIPIKTK